MSVFKHGFNHPDMKTVATEITDCYPQFPRREGSPCYAGPHEGKADRVVRREVD